jgi:hypothetical protein
MPKYLLAKMHLSTYVLEAPSRQEAEKALVEYQKKQMTHGENAKKPEQLVYTTYKLGWFETPDINPTVGRNKILAAFLELMQNTIPWVFEGGRIITIDEANGPLAKTPRRF